MFIKKESNAKIENLQFPRNQEIKELNQYFTTKIQSNFTVTASQQDQNIKKEWKNQLSHEQSGLRTKTSKKSLIEE